MKQRLTLNFMECSDLLLALYGRLGRLDNEIRASSDAEWNALRADEMQRIGALYNKISAYQQSI